MILHTSFHNGSKVRRDHNIRNRKVTDKEAHIDPNGVYEIWHDETLEDAYQRIFGQAIKDYNSKQKHKSRRISEDYLGEIKADKSKHPVYECIVGIYPQDGEKLTTDQSKEILKEFYEGWKEANPNMEVIGAYFHADEEGEPHIHIDYIPIGHYKQKAAVQNSLSRAFDEMGIKYQLADAENGISAKTPQMIWQDKERDRLDSICTEKGYTVEHPVIQGEAEARGHEDTRTYKNRKANEEAEKQLEFKENQIKDADAILEMNNQLIEQTDKQIDEQNVKLKEMADSYRTLSIATDQKKKDKDMFDDLTKKAQKAYEGTYKGQEAEYAAFKDFVQNRAKKEAEIAKLEAKEQRIQSQCIKLEGQKEDLKDTVKDLCKEVGDTGFITRAFQNISNTEKEIQNYDDMMLFVRVATNFLERKFPKILQDIMNTIQQLKGIGSRKSVIKAMQKEAEEKASAIEEEWERD